MAYLGSGHVLAAPLMALPEPAPAPLGAPVTPTHRVISYTYDALYRLISATYSTGEYYHPKSPLRRASLRRRGLVSFQVELLLRQPTLT